MKQILLTLLCAAALFGQEMVSRVVQIRHVRFDNSLATLGVLAPDTKAVVRGEGRPVQWRSSGVRRPHQGLGDP